MGTSWTYRYVPVRGFVFKVGKGKKTKNPTMLLNQ